jgi:VTC domain-containing protein
MVTSRSWDPFAHTVPLPLADLFPAHLIQKDVAAAERQHEHKFLLDADAARLVWAAASPHLEPLEDTTRPIAYVRTTYFDTPDLACYRSARGPVARRIRVREYASATSTDEPPRLAERCFLELKRSAGGLRSKTRLEIEPQTLAEVLARDADGPLMPVLTTWYHRRSLADRDGRLRLTLDDGICFCAPATVGGPCALTPPGVLARWPGLVLEIKRWGASPAWLTKALRGHVEAVGFSKFSAGMLAKTSAR